MQQRLWYRLSQRSAGLFLTALLIWSINPALTAQPLPYSVQQRAQIEKTRLAIQQFHDSNYQQAISIATQRGRPITTIRPDGRIIQLDGIAETGELLYKTTYSNARAAATTRTTSLYAGGSLGVSLSGSSATVQNRLGIWDGGRVRATHVELAGRVTQKDSPAATNTTDEGQEHATHVAGTMIANGLNPTAKGMAFGANLQAWDFNNDVSEISAASTNLLISNHSYGQLTGWDPGDGATDPWTWYGDTTISQTEDYKFGFYDTKTSNYDKIAASAPNYLIVESAGNARGYNGPADGASYFLGSNGNGTIRSTLPRSRQTGYDIITPYATAKNILTVGAVSAIANGYNQPVDVQIAYFSSWGPTDDGRIKPDLVGVGVSVLSLTNQSDSAYTTLSGTSMSSPNVAGSLLLLQEYYGQLNAGKLMRASTLKGLALHTANEAGPTAGPDYQFGWGLLNVERAGQVIRNTDRSNVLDERTVRQGETYSLSVVASGKGPLVATICWTDPEATATTVSRANLNNRTPKLVNDLDIRISDGTTNSLPWILDPDNPASAATRGDNIRDNVEQVLIANAVPGQSYTITVNHKGTLRNSSQDYALIVSGAGGISYCASAPVSNADTKISRVQFGGINQAGADGCTTYTDFTKTSTTIQAGQQVPVTVTLGTCGVIKNAVVKVFIDYNLNGVLDDAGETVAMSGLLTSTGTYSTTVTIPASVQVGQLLRMRVVAVETTDADNVRACGAYGNGETQDYVLAVRLTSNDVGATALVTPQSSFCGRSSGSTPIAVQVRNYGSVEQRNVPVTVQIINSSNSVVTTLNGIIPVLSAAGVAQLTLSIPASLTLAASQTYRFAITTALGTDQNNGNNTVIETRTTAALPGPGIFSALTCGQSTGVTLRNTGDGTASWYDAPTGGNLLAVGNSVTAVQPATGIYYAALNDFAGRLGPATKAEFGSGSYSGSFGPQPLLSAKVPLVLASARLYIGTPGQFTFSISRLDGTVVSSVTLDVLTTRTLPTSATIAGGFLADDPNDPGAEYPLNLTIPAAGDYKLTIGYANGASIFRSTTAVAGSTITASTFPVSLSNILSTKGSLFANATTGKTDTLTSAWYYLYNIQVRPLGCSNGQRVAVMTTTGTPPTASVTASGSTSICQGANVTLLANTGTGYSYQWYRNGQAISGATSNTILAATAGNYTVQVANGCPAVTSSAIPVAVLTTQTPVITANGFTLTSTAKTNIQWLLNGVPIAGATGASYTVVQSGRYSVKGSVNGCSDAISDEVQLTILATEPDPADNSLLVYPNPATHQITVTVATTAGGSPPALRLTDLRGLTVRTATLQRDGKNYSTVLDISDLPGGTFFVVVDDERTQTVRVKRIRKQ